MHDLIFVGHGNGDFLVCLFPVRRVDIDNGYVKQLIACFGKNPQDDRHPRHIPDHIGVYLIRGLIYTI